MGGICVKVKGIVKYQDKYLLIQKWYDDNIVNPYKWEFVDSVVEPGKGPDDIAVDSVEMGMGIEVEMSKILYTWTYTVGETFHIGIAYLCEADSDIVIMSDDYSKFVWVSSSELEDYIEDKNLIDDLKKHGIITSKKEENDELDQLELNV